MLGNGHYQLWMEGGGGVAGKEWGGLGQGLEELSGNPHYFLFIFMTH